MVLRDKVAIVTGASYGIGHAYALALAKEGATVVAGARSVGKLMDGVVPPDTLAETVAAGPGQPRTATSRLCSRA